MVLYETGNNCQVNGPIWPYEFGFTRAGHRCEWFIKAKAGLINNKINLKYCQCFHRFQFYPIFFAETIILNNIPKRFLWK